ncbi:MAG: diguanylate cyclase [Desulfuromonadales bacterium GWD2_54_10]|nr:MAG: diguanylate cyclase [Desulfuromonadales bacterium GWD2_54_10]
MTTNSDHTRYLELLERTNTELNIMVEIGKTLTSSLDLQEVLEVIMQKVGLLLKPKTWSLLLVDEKTDELYFEIVVSPVSELLKGIRLKMGEGIAGWVAQHGTSLLIEDVRNDERFALHVDDSVSFTTRSIICVPLKIRGRGLGVIELINSLDELQFNDADLKILGAIADYAAIAIDNARNFKMMNELVITDDLTGLFNANHFHTLLDAEIERSKRYATEFSLVFLDLDHFKSVNDTHGHLVGSRLLSEFGRLLKQHVRATDLGARYGGDEFVIILPNTTKSGALAMVGKLRGIIAGHHFLADTGERIAVTASYGIATFPEDADSKRGLIQAADQAMYQVKESTRDGVRVYCADAALLGG